MIVVECDGDDGCREVVSAVIEHRNGQKHVVVVVGSNSSAEHEMMVEVYDDRVVEDVKVVLRELSFAAAAVVTAVDSSEPREPKEEVEFGRT